MENSKVISVKEKISFIAANIDLIDEYQVKDIYLSVIRSRIKDEYGIYVDPSDLDHKLSYHDNWKNYHDKKIIKNFSSIKEYKFFKDFEVPARNIWKIENNKDVTIHCSGMSLYNLIYILLYVVFNEIDEDLARANKIEKDAGFGYGVTNFSYTDFGFFKGIQIRKTKNGQVTIKGLNDEQKERLNYLFTVTRKTV